MRYLTKELFMYFLVAFLFFFVVFFANQILLFVQKVLAQRAPVAQVLKLMLYSLPAVISQSAPFATLVGFLMCLGRISSDNEVLILRATGNSYVTILIPVLTLGLVISVFSFFVNDYLLPLGNLKFNRLQREIIQKKPTVEIEPNTVKKLKDTTLVIGNVVDNDVEDLVLFDSSDNSQRIIIAGRSSVVPSNEDGILMKITMDDSQVIMFDKSDRKKYDVLTSEVSNLNIFDTDVFGKADIQPREMTAYDLKRKINNLRNIEHSSKRQINQYVMEYYKKFSVPFGSIFFAMLALPLALIFGKHNGLTIGLVLGLLICFIYWFLHLYGQIFSVRRGWPGFWTMWGPNFLIGGTGIILYFSLRRR